MQCLNLRKSNDDSYHVHPHYDEDGPDEAGVGAEGVHHSAVPGKLKIIFWYSFIKIENSYNKLLLYLKNC